MFSRYSAMKESHVKDIADHALYPDPLSVNFNNTQMTQIPKLRTFSTVDLRRFWIFMFKQYGGIAEADDILLTLNSVPYLGMLQSGDNIYIIDISDLRNFSSQQKK